MSIYNQKAKYGGDALPASRHLFVRFAIRALGARCWTVTLKPYYCHEDFAYVNGFPNFAGDVYVVTLATCSTSDNISFNL